MLYIATHLHRFGNSTYLVECDHEPSEVEVLEYCEIEYEPERDESIELRPAVLIKIP